VQDNLLLRRKKNKVMEELKFKTNIKCSGCVANTTPYLNEVAGDGNWNVNVVDPSKILTVTSARGKQNEIIKAVEKAGYKAEAI
jgi:copper chaperone CopZ